MFCFFSLSGLAQALSEGKQGMLSFISEAMIMGISIRGKEILEIFPLWIFCVAVASASEFALQLPGPRQAI